MRGRRGIVVCAAVAIGTGVAIGAPVVSAAGGEGVSVPGVEGVQLAPEQGAEACDAWDVEYAVAAKLQLSNTVMGAGDGIFPVGPGALVVRFMNVNGQPGGATRMRSYAMRERFQVDSTALFWTTHVLIDTKTVTTPDACGDVAKGQLEGGTVRWQTPMSGSRTDGTLTCDGTLCGNFGAPPSGKSEFHLPPHAVASGPFVFAADMKTFSMPSTLVSKAESPRQNTHVTLAGREVRRTCVRVAACP